MKHRTLVGTTVGFVGLGSTAAILAPIAQDLEQRLDLSPLALGLLLACPALSGALLRLPTAPLADRGSARAGFALLGLLGLAGVGLLALGAESRPVWEIALAAVLAGCALGSFSLGSGQLIHRYPQGGGWAQGVYGGLGNLGPGLALLLSPLVLAQGGARLLYTLWAAGMVLALGIYAWLSDKSTPVARSLVGPRPKFWLLTLQFFLGFGGFVALSTWLPVALQRGFELKPAQSLALAGLFALAAPLSRMAAGALSDRIGHTHVLQGSHLLVIVGTLALLAGISPVLALLALAAGLGGMMGGCFAAVAQQGGTQAGWLAGRVGGLGALGAIFLPPLLGLWAEFGPNGYATGLLIFPALALVFGTLERLSPPQSMPASA